MMWIHILAKKHSIWYRKIQPLALLYFFIFRKWDLSRIHKKMFMSGVCVSPKSLYEWTEIEIGCFSKSNCRLIQLNCWSRWSFNRFQEHFALIFVFTFSKILRWHHRRHHRKNPMSTCGFPTHKTPVHSMNVKYSVTISRFYLSSLIPPKSLYLVIICIVSQPTHTKNNHEENELIQSRKCSKAERCGHVLCIHAQNYATDSHKIILNTTSGTMQKPRTRWREKKLFINYDKHDNNAGKSLDAHNTQCNANHFHGNIVI